MIAIINQQIGQLQNQFSLATKTLETLAWCQIDWTDVVLPWTRIKNGSSLIFPRCKKRTKWIVLVWRETIILTSVWVGALGVGLVSYDRRMRLPSPLIASVAHYIHEGLSRVTHDFVTEAWLVNSDHWLSFAKYHFPHSPVIYLPCPGRSKVIIPAHCRSPGTPSPGYKYTNKIEGCQFDRVFSSVNPR